jgi:casein kinase 1
MLQEVEGIPNVFWFGSEGEYNVMVMDLLGPSLEDLFTYCNQKFSLKTVLMIAEQLFSRIEGLHGKNFVHRDIRPENFLIGLGQRSHVIYLVDFGLSKKFRDTKSLAHIPIKQGKKLLGTARYASAAGLMGIEVSRRDDIESLFYVLAYLLNGCLPWQGLTGSKEEKYAKILEMKKNLTVDGSLNELPQEILAIFSYSRSLKFEEKPDYGYLKGLVKSLLSKEKMANDFIFDWTVRNYRKNKPLRSKLIEDLRNNNLLNESKVVQDESMVELQDTSNPQLPPSKEEDLKSKCTII